MKVAKNFEKRVKEYSKSLKGKAWETVFHCIIFLTDLSLRRCDAEFVNKGLDRSISIAGRHTSFRGLPACLVLVWIEASLRVVVEMFLKHPS